MHRAFPREMVEIPWIEVFPGLGPNGSQKDVLIDDLILSKHRANGNSCTSMPNALVYL